MPPNARHAVFTIVDSMMGGIHFYYHSQLQRSFCGWVVSRFTFSEITNAAHFGFLSIIQAFSTFYAPTFNAHQMSMLSADDPGKYFQHISRICLSFST